MNKSIYIVILISVTVLAACSGGGGGGGGGGSHQSTSAIMHVLTSAGTTTIYGSSGIGVVGLAVTFPPGVSVKTDPAGAVDSSAVVLSGVVTSGSAFLLPPVYTAATSTLPGRLDLVVASSTGSGFGTGEFLTINFIISSGAPTAGSFVITDFVPKDLSIQTITGMASGSTVDIR